MHPVRDQGLPKGSAEESCTPDDLMSSEHSRVYEIMTGNGDSPEPIPVASLQHCQPLLKSAGMGHSNVVRQTPELYRISEERNSRR